MVFLKIFKNSLESTYVGVFFKVARTTASGAR